jgi:hypothetical protein
LCVPSSPSSCIAHAILPPSATRSRNTDGATLCDPDRRYGRTRVRHFSPFDSRSE